MKEQLFMLKQYEYKQLNLNLINKLSLNDKINNSLNVNSNIYCDKNVYLNIKYLNILHDKSINYSKFLNYLFRNFVLFQGKGLKHFRDSITKEFYVITLVSLEKNQIILFSNIINELNVISNLVNSQYQNIYTPKKLSLLKPGQKEIINFDPGANNLVKSLNSLFFYKEFRVEKIIIPLRKRNKFFYRLIQNDKITISEPLIWDRRSISMFFYRIILQLIHELIVSSSIDITRRWVFQSGKSFESFLRFINIYSNNFEIYNRLRRQRFFARRRYKRRLLKLRRRYLYKVKRRANYRLRRFVYKKKVKVSSYALINKKTLLNSLFTQVLGRLRKYFYVKKSKVDKNVNNKLLQVNSKLVRNLNKDFNGQTVLKTLKCIIKSKKISCTYNEFNLLYKHYLNHYRYKFVVVNLGGLFNCAHLGVFKSMGLFFPSILYKFLMRRVDRRNFLKLRMKVRFKKHLIKFFKLGKIKLNEASISYILELYLTLYRYRLKLLNFKTNFYKQLINNRLTNFINNFELLNKNVVWWSLFFWFFDSWIVHYVNIYKKRQKINLVLYGLQNRTYLNYIKFQIGIKYLLLNHSTYVKPVEAEKLANNFIVLNFLIFMKNLKLMFPNLLTEMHLAIIYSYCFDILNKLTTGSIVNIVQLNIKFLLVFSKLSVILSMLDKQSVKSGQINCLDFLVLNNILKLIQPKLLDKEM